MKRLMLWSVGIVLLLMGTKTMLTVPSYRPGECFREHIHEAIQLNEIRKPLYSHLSNGASAGVSTQLIWMERASLLLGKVSPSHRFDVRDKPYRDAGMSILCADLVSMRETPAFAERHVDSLPQAHVYALHSTATVKDELSVALDRRGFEGLAETAALHVQRLGDKRTNCLVRHLLESVARVSTLAPGQILTARQKGLPSPEPLIRDLIDFHLTGVGIANRLDKGALTTQKMGIPFLCQDVPAIPHPGSMVN